MSGVTLSSENTALASLRERPLSTSYMACKVFDFPKGSGSSWLLVFCRSLKNNQTKGGIHDVAERN